MTYNSMCKLCNFNFKSRSYLILHLGTYHGIQNPESVAHTMFNVNHEGADPGVESNNNNQGSIKSTACSKDIPFKHHCEQCNITFKFRCLFQRHMSPHNPGTHACQYCPKLFKRKDILKEHQYLHLGGTKHKCKDCKREFQDNRNLNVHVKLKHKGSLIKCPKCPKKYSGQRQLKYHDNRMHTFKKPYKCSKCDESFPVPCLLAEHRKKTGHLKD